MDVDGKGSSWRHCRKGAEHVTHVALFTFSTAMLLALFSFFNGVAEAFRCVKISFLLTTSTSGSCKKKLYLFRCLKTMKIQ